VTVGTLLGGFVITHYGIQHLPWMSITLFVAALGVSMIVVKKKDVPAGNGYETALPVMDGIIMEGVVTEEESEEGICYC
jgi:hypothetical protein